MTDTALPDLPELHFPAGVPGFPAAHRFALVRLTDDDDTPFALLRCLDAADLEFVVVHPFDFFPAYAPELDDETAERLDLHSAEDALILAIVTVPDKVQDATANLAAPIVVNRHTRQALQTVLSDSVVDLRTPLAQ